MEDPLWAGAFEAVLRRRAIVRGLDQVFKMSLAEENFNLFGDDMIQCFYDIATVSGEPVRNHALKYVEHLAHRWKHQVMGLRG